MIEILLKAFTAGLGAVLIVLFLVAMQWYNPPLPGYWPTYMEVSRYVLGVMGAELGYLWTLKRSWSRALKVILGGVLFLLTAYLFHKSIDIAPLPGEACFYRYAAYTTFILNYVAFGLLVGELSVFLVYELPEAVRKEK